MHPLIAPSDIASHDVATEGAAADGGPTMGGVGVSLSGDQVWRTLAERDLLDIPTGGVSFSELKKKYDVVYAVASYSDGNRTRHRVVGCAFYAFVTPARGSQLYVYVPVIHVTQKLLDGGTEGTNWNPGRVGIFLLQYIAAAIEEPTQRSIVLAYHQNASPPPPVWLNEACTALAITEIITTPEVLNLTLPDHDENVTTLWGQRTPIAQVAASAVARLKAADCYKPGCRRAHRAVSPLKEQEEAIIKATRLSPPKLGASPPCDDCDMREMLPT